MRETLLVFSEVTWPGWTLPVAPTQCPVQLCMVWGLKESGSDQSVWLFGYSCVIECLWFQCYYRHVRVFVRVFVRACMHVWVCVWWHKVAL